jgi:adenylate cyclase
MHLLRITDSKGQEKHYSLTQKSVSIGRDKGNDLVLPDQGVSRYHAKLSKQKKGYSLVDLDSINGTFVNDETVKSRDLKNLDRIKIGANTLIFVEQPDTKTSLGKKPPTAKEKEMDWADRTISIAACDTSQLHLQTLSIAGHKTVEKKRPTQAEKPEKETTTESVSLERANKTLYVLYEVSRKLNSMGSFEEILTEMMDLIFQVIDADYGFLILTNQDNEDFNPLIVKHREKSKKGKKEIKASRTIIDRVVKDKVALLTTNAIEDSRLGATDSLILQNIRSAMCVPLWKRDEIIGVIQLNSVRLENRFGEDDLELLKTIGCQMAMLLEQASLNEKLRQEESMRGKLERFHSPQVIELILNSDQETQENIMEARELTATVLFSDIVDFTALSEKMEPQEINIFLNRYFSKMTDIVFENDGTLDKYIGDGLLAVFGAPFEKEDDAARAVRTALKMREEVSKMNSSPDKTFEINIRIGINTGQVTAGNIGSEKRMEYTVLGDTVNVASRLEAAAKLNQILIGQETFRIVKDLFKIKDVGLRKLKGKSQDLKVYEVLG